MHKGGDHGSPRGGNPVFELLLDTLGDNGRAKGEKGRKEVHTTAAGETFAGGVSQSTA